ncbi:MAG: DNA adenine methylase [Sphaerochaetaceae bacterium]
MQYTLPQYETDQLVSLIGGKRSLQEPLRLLITELLPKRGPALFLDPFCGSGAVARLARSLGCKVVAGDLEPFSFITNYVYLSLDCTDLPHLFKDSGGVDAYLSMLNLQGLYAATTGMVQGQAYLSRYYAPQDDTAYDGERERLFYTHFNAVFLDTVRNELELNWLSGKISAVEKCIVLASIIYEASRRANTSGSFTAYHKRFGSYENTALSRIAASAELHAPTLPEEGRVAGEMHAQEAVELIRQHSADICFLDPPASIHQYGSGYHILNSVAMWDHLAPGDGRDSQGRLLDRSGIRSDWKRTHSAFCSLKSADAAMVHLLGSVDARHIVLTYPSGGILEAQRIHELLCARHDTVRVISLRKRNQGGRQPANGLKNNGEQVFITGKAATVSLLTTDAMAKLPLLEQLQALCNVVFHPREDCGPFHYVGGVILDDLPPVQEILSLSADDLASYLQDAQGSRCDDVRQALAILVEALGLKSLYPVDSRGRVRIEKRIISILRRFCNPGHREDFDRLYTYTCSLVVAEKTLVTLGKRLDALGTAADYRIRS